MKKDYQILGKKDTKELTEYLTRNGQLLLPMLELIESSRMAVDELIDYVGRSSIEALLELSACAIAGEKHQGKRGEDIYRNGHQQGKVTLAERKVHINKPRLRRKGSGTGTEVDIPVYEAMNSEPGMSERVLEIMMRGVSTRNYEHVISEMAETLGVSKSSVSREFIKSSGRELEEICERRFADVDFLVIYIDGMVFADHHVIAAVGVALDGTKHILGLCEGASENAASAVSLLESMVERGIDPSKKYLFVIDGSKALRSAVKRVFGDDQKVQRCRSHKVRNVCDKLPKELKGQVKTVMRAAYKLNADKGMAKLKKQAEWLKIEHPGAAASLLEGLEETFTINRMDLSSSLMRCLGTTNIIESPNSGVRQKTRRVSRWKNGKMVMRWAASGFLATEKNFRKIMGYKDLWMLEVALGRKKGKVDNRTEAA